MSDKEYENQGEDLTAFEAALGSLRPRGDRLDPRWRSLLAKEAALMSPLPPGESQGEGNMSPLLPGEGQGEGCKLSGGHRFICVRCGREAPTNQGVGRWAWPAAFSTVTAVAAILLVMLTTRTQPQMAERGNEQGVAPTASSSADKMEAARELGFGLAAENASWRPSASDTGEMSYLKLRDQVLRDGVESWKSPASAVVTTTQAPETPLSYRQQLDLLLKQQGLRGS